MKIYCCEFKDIDKLKETEPQLIFHSWIHPLYAINYYKDYAESYPLPIYESNPIILQWLLVHKEELKAEFYWFDVENFENLNNTGDYNKLFLEQAQIINELINERI